MFKNFFCGFNEYLLNDSAARTCISTYKSELSQRCIKRGKWEREIQILKVVYVKL